MTRYRELLADQETFLELKPEQLAGPLLAELVILEDGGKNPLLLHNNLGGLAGGNSQEIARAVSETWGWLEHEGLLGVDPKFMGGKFLCITRKGHEFARSKDMTTCLRTNILPKDLLHPVIVRESWLDFKTGRFDNAVLNAFKQVEVAVREASGLKELIGIPLAHTAFHKDNGPLTDKDAHSGERNALAQLMGGAFGYYRNAHGHRNVKLDAEEAAEVIIFASHLIKIVDARKEMKEAETSTD